jgi:hypothetical protein
MIGRLAYRRSGHTAKYFRLRPYEALLQPGSATPTSSGAAGLITATSVSSRQVRFGLKLL